MKMACRAANGQGLASMKRRAQSIGGKLDILARTGRSTTITLQAPLRRRSLRRLNIRIYEKLQVHSKSEAVSKALRHRLI